MGLVKNMFLRRLKFRLKSFEKLKFVEVLKILQSSLPLLLPLPPPPPPPSLYKILNPFFFSDLCWGHVRCTCVNPTNCPRLLGNDIY